MPSTSSISYQTLQECNHLQCSPTFRNSDIAKSYHSLYSSSEYYQVNNKIDKRSISIDKSRRNENNKCLQISPTRTIATHECKLVYKSIMLNSDIMKDDVLFKLESPERMRDVGPGAYQTELRSAHQSFNIKTSEAFQRLINQQLQKNSSHSNLKSQKSPSRNDRLSIYSQQQNSQNSIVYKLENDPYKNTKKLLQKLSQTLQQTPQKEQSLQDSLMQHQSTSHKNTDQSKSIQQKSTTTGGHKSNFSPQSPNQNQMSNHISHFLPAGNLSSEKKSDSNQNVNRNHPSSFMNSISTSKIQQYDIRYTQSPDGFVTPIQNLATYAQGINIQGSLISNQSPIHLGNSDGQFEYEQYHQQFQSVEKNRERVLSQLMKQSPATESKLQKFNKNSSPMKQSQSGGKLYSPNTQKYLQKIREGNQRNYNIMSQQRIDSQSVLTKDFELSNTVQSNQQHFTSLQNFLSDEGEIDENELDEKQVKTPVSQKFQQLQHQKYTEISIGYERNHLQSSESVQSELISR
ncbi:UNKNOWN [Stylonychia lemnae]|uniref:Uncharacterized protein n=1 Tax=Stylonychia lemnae TaxID=5949 RepID=A0A077ZTV0_STYLE|nr:UNKNOWN [Stylonychia lemnae]|eukprot:CDW71871.1 UNKNOWN [Stylonychia lemnae]